MVLRCNASAVTALILLVVLAHSIIMLGVNGTSSCISEELKSVVKMGKVLEKCGDFKKGKVPSKNGKIRERGHRLSAVLYSLRKSHDHGHKYEVQTAITRTSKAPITAKHREISGLQNPIKLLLSRLNDIQNAFVLSQQKWSALKIGRGICLESRIHQATESLKITYHNVALDGGYSQSRSNQQNHNQVSDVRRQSDIQESPSNRSGCCLEDKVRPLTEPPHSLIWSKETHRPNEKLFIDSTVHVVWSPANHRNQQRSDFRNRSYGLDRHSTQGTMSEMRNDSWSEEFVSSANVNDKYCDGLSIISLCITLLALRNEDLKQKMKLMFSALWRRGSIRRILQVFCQNISSNSSVSAFSCEIASSKSSSDKFPCSYKTANRLDHVSKSTLKKEDISNDLTWFDLEKETAVQKLTEKEEKLSQFYNTPAERFPAVFTVFPALFLPSVGSLARDSMSYLGCRLASLSALPTSCTVSRVRLAQAGFFYDRTNTPRDASNVDEVVCYSCGVSHSAWTAEDNPTTVHLALRPDCEHLKSLDNNSTTSNELLPLLGPENASATSVSGITSAGVTSATSATPVSFSQCSMGSVSTLSVSKHSSFISAGSASSQTSEVVRLPQLVGDARRQLDNARNSSDGGDLSTDSAAIIPSLPATSSYVPQPQAPPPANHRSFFESGDFSNARALDMANRPPVLMSDAVYPQFCRISERRETFTKWPLTQHFHPDDLAMQGFYYAGYADCIRCFYCGVGLKEWSENDDVMVEHIRWRPSCGYILNTKGRLFVNRIFNNLQSENGGQPERISRDLSQTSTPSATTANTRTGLSSSPPSSASVSDTSSSSDPSVLTASGVSSSLSSASISSSAVSVASSASSGRSPVASSDGSSARSIAPSESGVSATASSAASSTISDTSSYSGVSSTASSAVSSAPSSTSSVAASSTASAASPFGVEASSGSREIMRKVKEMGFPDAAITRAIRHLKDSGVTTTNVGSLVEAIVALDSEDNTTTVTTTTNSNNNSDNETLPPHDLSPDGAAESEYAQRIREENERLKASRRCKLCHVAPVGLIFLPCGHLLACPPCGARTKNCTLCGQLIRATANVYLS